MGSVEVPRGPHGMVAQVHLDDVGRVKDHRGVAQGEEPLTMLLALRERPVARSLPDEWRWALLTVCRGVEHIILARPQHALADRDGVLRGLGAQRGEHAVNGWTRRGGPRRHRGRSEASLPPRRAPRRGIADRPARTGGSTSGISRDLAREDHITVAAPLPGEGAQGRLLRGRPSVTSERGRYRSRTCVPHHAIYSVPSFRMRFGSG